MYIRTTATAVAALLYAGMANANTLTIEDVVDDTSGPYVSITCDPDCNGIDYLGMEDNDSAEAVPGSPANDEQIVADYTSLTGVSPDLVSVDYKIDGEVSEFTVGPGVFFVKKADWRAFFVASAETSVTTSDTISNYGEINVVPLPAGVWLLLGGLGGLAALRRKRAA
jgi:hypothetical protein